MKHPKPTGRLSYDEHVQLAQHIAEAGAHLFAVANAIQAAYGVSDRAMSPLKPMILNFASKLSILKCRLDDHFYHDDHQGRSPYYTPEIRLGSEHD